MKLAIYHFEIKHFLIVTSDKFTYQYSNSVILNMDLERDHI